jgi:hypothetical protein
LILIGKCFDGANRFCAIISESGKPEEEIARWYGAFSVPFLTGPRVSHIYQGGRQAMKRYLTVTAITVLCLGLFCGLSVWNDEAQAQGKAAQEKITVINPMGTPPPIEVKPMAESLSTLDGKTIYLINTGFPNTERLMEEYKQWFQANYPKTTIVDQRTGMSNLTPALKKELEEKADAVIFALGH